MAKRPLILVVEDEEWARKFLRELLEKESYRVDDAADGAQAIKKMGEGLYDLVITDLKMEGYDGIDVLKAAKSHSYDPEVLLVTAYGTVESAIEAIKLGAFDYLTKPLDSNRLIVTVGQALDKRRLKGEVENLRSQVGERYSRKKIIAASSKMKKVLELVELVSGTDSTVLIEGESGTGKELVARAIHFSGTRAKRPFIAVNCGALPEPLLESELFGHVKGSFTGAIRDKKGLFEEADGGTLLLDEIGDMPSPIQVKLLRVLQEGEIRRVGGNSNISVDVRIIASTNRKLSALVEEGEFREDLFYRLNVIPITIPPLRERRDDIAPLINHFVGVYKGKLKKDVEGFSPEALEILLNHDWPGNIRELENVVERAMTLGSYTLISSSDLTKIFYLGKSPSKSTEPESDDFNLHKAHEMLEREYILKALKKNDWNQSQAAKDLGIDRSSLWRKMKEYGIKCGVR
jgi:DNA-binding NtrC family response regulator